MNVVHVQQRGPSQKIKEMIKEMVQMVQKMAKWKATVRKPSKLPSNLSQYDTDLPQRSEDMKIMVHSDSDRLQNNMNVQTTNVVTA
jgi:hypothetical protein